MTAALVAVAAIDPLTSASLAVFAGFVLVGAATLGGSLYFGRRNRRRDDDIETLRSAIVPLANHADTDWESWVEQLPDKRRERLRPLIRRQLPHVSGEYRRALRSLAITLDLDDRARTRLESSDERTRLEALNWLTLLDVPVDEDVLFRPEASPRERAVVARYLYERSGAAAAETATEYLLADGEPIPGYGLETLYRFNRADPRPLLDALEKWVVWDRTLTVQTLSVLRSCEPAAPDLALRRLVPCLNADAAATRAMAIHALGPYVGTVDVGEHVAVESLVSDPSTRVRTAAYRQFADAEDHAVVDLLAEAVIREDDENCKYAGVSYLAAHFERRGETPASVRQLLSWYDQTGDEQRFSWPVQWDMEWEHTEPPEVTT